MAEMKTLTINGEQFTLPFAPSGYGLGTVAATAPDRNPDNITATGFYRCEIPELMGNTAWWVGYHACTYSDNSYAVQEFTYHGAYITCKVRRDRIDGKWQPWEWVNPPMTLGIEYRTTKRHNGKVVYTKLVNVGQLPNTSTKNIDGVVVDGCTGFVSQSVRLVSPFDTPQYDASDNRNLDIKRYYDGTYGWLIIDTTSDLSFLTCYITLEYTKD